MPYLAACVVDDVNRWALSLVTGKNSAVRDGDNFRSLATSGDEKHDEPTSQPPTCSNAQWRSRCLGAG